MSMQNSYVQPQDISIKDFYLGLLGLVLILAILQNAILLGLLFWGSLQACRSQLKIIIVVKIVASCIYVALECSRSIAFLATYQSSDPIFVENYIPCGLYYWITSASQWTVSFMITWATLFRVLTMYNNRFYVAYCTGRTAIACALVSVVLIALMHIHYYFMKFKMVTFTCASKGGLDGTYKTCVSTSKFCEDAWPIIDALINTIVPGVVWLSLHIMIRSHFKKVQLKLLELPPSERNQVRYEKQHNKVHIAETGWTKATVYAGLLYFVSNLPLNIYLWYYEMDKFSALLAFNKNETRSLLLIFEMLKFCPYLMWFSIYNLSGCDGKTALTKKTISQEMMKISQDNKHYNLRVRSSRSNEENRF